MDTLKYINMGKNFIHKSKWDMWKEYVELLFRENSDNKETENYLLQILNIMNNLSNKPINEILVELQDNYGNLNQPYIKNMAEIILKYHSKGPMFFDRFINTFDYVSQEEDCIITENINKVKRINKLIDEGLSYEDAVMITNLNTSLIPLTFGDKYAEVIKISDNIYRGLTDDNKLVIYADISIYIGVIYVFDNNKYYTRYLYNTFDKETYFNKMLITRNNQLVEITKEDVQFSNFPIPSADLADIYNKSEELYRNLDLNTTFKILKEIAELSSPINSESKITNAEAIINTTRNLGK